MHGDFQCRRCHAIVPWTNGHFPRIPSHPLKILRIFFYLGTSLTLPRGFAYIHQSTYLAFEKRRHLQRCNNRLSHISWDLATWISWGLRLPTFYDFIKYSCHGSWWVCRPRVWPLKGSVGSDSRSFLCQLECMQERLHERLYVVNLGHLDKNCKLSANAEDSIR
jgi:hypothetical protein